MQSTLLVSRVVWAAWHTPILGGVYAFSSSPAVSAAVFAVSAIGQGLLLAYVRLPPGSIWPAIVGHAAWNAVIQRVVDRSTGIQIAVHWVGEDGILVALFALVIAIAFTLQKRRPLVAPRDPLPSFPAASWAWSANDTRVGAQDKDETANW